MRFKLLLLLLPCALLGKELFEEPWGKDAGLKAPPPAVQMKAPSMPVRIADAVIRFHQQVISPVDGPRSHYRPSSSRYMQLAMERYGFIKGFLMGCDRLLRENDEEWIYPSIEENGQWFKYDPAWADKNHELR